MLRTPLCSFLLIAAMQATEPVVASADSASLAERVTELEAQNRELLERVTILEQLIADLPHASNSDNETAAGDLMGPDDFVTRRADEAALAALIRPDAESSVEGVRRYLDDLTRLTRNQNTFSPTDTQVGMIREIPSQFFPIILDYWKRPLNFHMDHAVKGMDLADQRELVIENLPAHPALAPVILRYGWEEGARGRIDEALQVNLQRPEPALVRLAASYQDAELHAILRRVLVYSSNRDEIYPLLLGLEDFPLDEAVQEAWRIARHADNWQRTSFASIAARHGMIEALGHLIEAANSAESDWLRQRAREGLVGLLPPGVTVTRAGTWFESYGDRLVYEPGTRSYRVTENADEAESAHPDIEGQQGD